jgi:hypothetical protein
MVLGLFGVQWVMPCHVLDLRAGWQGRHGSLENGSSLCNVVSMEGEEYSTPQGLRKIYLCS